MKSAKLSDEYCSMFLSEIVGSKDSALQSAPPTSKSKAMRELDLIPEMSAGLSGDSTNALARTNPFETSGRPGNGAKRRARWEQDCPS